MTEETHHASKPGCIDLPVQSRGKIITLNLLLLAVLRTTTSKIDARESNAAMAQAVGCEKYSSVDCILDLWQSALVDKARKAVVGGQRLSANRVMPYEPCASHATIE